jgi:hypothetical protein
MRWFFIEMARRAPNHSVANAREIYRPGLSDDRLAPPRALEDANDQPLQHPSELPVLSQIFGSL